MAQRTCGYCHGRGETLRWERVPDPGSGGPLHADVQVWSPCPLCQGVGSTWEPDPVVVAAAPRAGPSRRDGASGAMRPFSGIDWLFGGAAFAGVAWLVATRAPGQHPAAVLALGALAGLIGAAYWRFLLVIAGVAAAIRVLTGAAA